MSYEQQTKCPSLAFSGQRGMGANLAVPDHGRLKPGGSPASIARPVSDEICDSLILEFSRNGR
jgi:hypothetical protein